MTGTVSGAIGDEQIVKRNSLAAVTEHYLVIRRAERQAHVIIPRSRIARMDTRKHTYSGMLAIAGAIFILSAAAFSSSDGDGFGFPLAAAGLLVLTGYVMNRRAEVRLVLDSGLTEVIAGRIDEAESLVELISSSSRPRASANQSFFERFRHLIPGRQVSFRNT